jgi:hypothetical protein
MFSQDPQSKFPVLFSFSLLYNLHITVVSKQLKGFNFKMVKSPTYSLEVVDPGRFFQGGCWASIQARLNQARLNQALISSLL